MNLMNFFNFSYLKQNLKKSKATLAFVLLILPILTFIILLMIGKQESITVLDLNDISILTAFGMFILPGVISLLLFNFVFKKKSVDFMGSMPLDRKAIFFTNTLGGILIFAGLLFITMLLIMITSLILPNLYIPLGVCIDYFILFFASYVFVFTACNIAVSLAGNVITSIIVTMLILFFVPFHHYTFSIINWNANFTSAIYEMEYENLPKECEKDDIDCIKNKDYSIAYFQPIEENTNYTMPFGVFANSTDTMSDTLSYRSTVVAKMTVLSILYICIGYLLFEKKEMEVCETSFKKFWQHQLVKILTLIPICVLASLVLYEADMMIWVLAIAMLLIYNFIYDLITRHSIHRILANIICFALTFIIVVFSTAKCFYDGNRYYNSEDNKIELKDIENIQIDTKYLDSFSKNQWIIIKEKEIIKESITNIKESSHNASLIVTANGKKYRTSTYLDIALKEKILSYASNEKQYQEPDIKEILKKSKIVTIGEDYTILDKEGIKLLEEGWGKKSNKNTKFSIPINIYTYENHFMRSYTIDSNIEENLQKYIIQKHNEKVRTIKLETVYSINAVSENSSVEYTCSGYKNAKNLVEYLFQKKNIDFTQPIYRISIYFSNHRHLYYYTNLDEESLSYLESVKMEDTEQLEEEKYAN